MLSNLTSYCCFIAGIITTLMKIDCFCNLLRSGVSEGDRTLDPSIANVVFSLLSYLPDKNQPLNKLLPQQFLNLCLIKPFDNSPHDHEGRC